MKIWMFILILCFASPTTKAQVGINTSAPLSMLDINGNLSVKHVSLTGSNSITNINDGVYISVNPTSTDQEFTLPDPASVPGRIYFIRNVSGSTAKLTMYGGKNFYFSKSWTGSSTQIYMYSNDTCNCNPGDHPNNGSGYRSLIIISDGNNWNVFN